VANIRNPSLRTCRTDEWITCSWVTRGLSLFSSSGVCAWTTVVDATVSIRKNVIFVVMIIEGKVLLLWMPPQPAQLPPPLYVVALQRKFRECD
jgi:hypothetical protein